MGRREMSFGQRMPREVTPETSARITNMSLLCALLVIMIHMPPTLVPNVDAGLLIQVMRRVTAVAVPFFFTAAGYFLAGHTHESSWYRREVCKRFRSLLIPLWITAVLLFLWSVPLILAANVYANTSLFRNFPQGFADWLVIAGLHPFENPLTPLWFLRTLFLFVVISPMLIKPIRWAIWTAVALLFVTWGAWTGFFYALSCGMIVKESPLEEVLTWTFSLKNLFFFSAGMMLRYYPLRLPESPWVCLVAGISGVGIALWAASLGVKDYIYLPLLVTCLYRMVPSKAWHRKLTTCAFPIYLLHMFVSFVMYTVIKNINVLACLHGNAVGWVIDSGIVFVVCIFVTLGLRRFFPRLSYWWFGGR